MTFTRPKPGYHWTLYERAAFYPCRDHPDAEAVTVLVVTEDDAYMDEPLCAECGKPVLPPWAR